MIATAVADGDDELPAGTRVINRPFARHGTLVRYEFRHGTRWAVVQWDGESFTRREYPSRIEAA